MLIMEAMALSPDFTDVVLEILMHHKDRVKDLRRRTRQGLVTSNTGFIFPFEHTVVHGLYSGEKNEWFLGVSRFLRKQSCYRAAVSSFDDSYHKLARLSDVRSAVGDLFDVSYGLGTEFHGIEVFRDDD